MTYDEIRENFSSGKLTWGDLLTITGLPVNELFDILYDLINNERL